MDDETELFIVLAEQCELIRDEWRHLYAIWRDTASAETLHRCTLLIHELHLLCAKMDAIIRRSITVLPA